MAYVFGFPADVTKLIHDMRDWRYEQVRAEGGTPFARMMHRPWAPSLHISRIPPPPTYDMEDGVPIDVWAWTRLFTEPTEAGPVIRIREMPIPGLAHATYIDQTRWYGDISRPAADMWQSEPRAPDD